MHIFLEVITFLIVIIVLVLVHELGHFIVAKLSGMRVDEFGFGFPPRALTLGKIGETEYTLNWLPLGGFVRIYGEDGVEENSGTEENKEVMEHKDASRAFSAKPHLLQALVLVAGIVMNVLFAYVLINISQVIGTQQILTYGQEGAAKNVNLAFAEVLPGGPADLAGLQAGDIVKNAEVVQPTIGISYNGTNPAGLITLIGTDSSLSPITFSIERNGKPLTIIATPKLHVIPTAPMQPGVGVAVVEVGIIKTPLIKAPIESLQVLWNMTSQTAGGLYEFFKGIVTFKADLSQVSGPVGIAGIVGEASSTGFGQLLSLTALISINLAIINLIPIPALDGGRLLFVIIEAASGRKINVKIAERVNMVGFTLLILLMLVVTAHDIFKLFH